MTKMTFKTSEKAFEYYYDKILNAGIPLDNTKYLQNVGFYIKEPLNNSINLNWRKWKPDYAEYEWNWYLSENRSVEEIKKKAKIWDSMHNGDNIVNSNYGYQWNRNGQLDHVINELTNKPTSRRAVISIYDGKEHQLHSYDTPCTLSISFNISNNKLNMSVIMRSNDLWFGFCNDQYCFSKLQELVAKRLNKKIGWYYHFAHNLHLYERHYQYDMRCI
jgi:thymidylate synthase